MESDPTGHATEPIGAGFSDVDRREDQEFFFRLLDDQSAAPGVVAARARAKAILAPRPGMRILDVGCGTGEAARELAGAVTPGGAVLAIDYSETMLEEARRRTREPLQIEYRAGDAQKLELPDASFDAARSERTLQHLVNPDLALAEMIRLVRPGGRIVVIDTDWDTAVLDLSDDKVRAKLRGGRDIPSRTIGSRLYGMFKRAGLTEVEAHGELLLLPTWDPATGRGAPVDRIVARAVQAGDLAAEEGERVLVELASKAKDGTFFGSVSMYIVSGRKSGEAVDAP